MLTISPMMAMATMPASPAESWKLSWLRCTKAPMPFVDSNISEVIVTKSEAVIARRRPVTIPGMDVRKDVLQTLHTPVIYIQGGPTDIAYANGMDDFKRIGHVPVAIANLPVGHGGTFLEPNGGAAASVAVSWLDWQLRGDPQSAKRFVGDDCGLCGDTRWSLERKQFPGAGASK